MRKYRIENKNGELVISWKRSVFIAIILLFMGIIWSFLSLIFVQLDDAIALYIIPVVSLLILYCGLVMAINRAKIRASTHFIKVEHGPLPWPGSKTIKVADVDQLFVIQEGKQKVNEKVTLLYSVKAKMRDASEKPLLLAGMIESRERALEMEALLERHLHIEDVAIKLPDDPFIAKLKERFPAFENVQLPGPINDGKPGALELDLPNLNEQGGGDFSKSPEVNGVGPRLLEGFAEQDVFARQLGATVELTGARCTIASHLQYDWSDGRSDVAFQLNGADAQTTEIYAEQIDGHKYLYYEERLLEEEEHEQLGFVAGEEPPNIVKNGDDKYYRRNEVNGLRFLDHGRSVNHVQQWIYFTTITHDRFRVVQARDGKLRVYIQEALAEDNLRVVELSKEKRRG